MKTLPNMLTVSRMILTVIFIILIFQPGLMTRIMAAVVFLAASLTDLCDGYYARKHNLITDFGKLMDPIADKFLILGAFFVFMQMHLIAVWMFLAIFIREIFITFWRLWAIKKGEVMAAEKAGKIKTTLQMTVIFLILFYLIIIELHILASSYHLMFLGISWLMLAVVFVTIISGVSYLWNNKRFLHA